MLLLKREKGAPLTEAELQQRKDAARARWANRAAVTAAGAAVGAVAGAAFSEAHTRELKARWMKGAAKSQQRWKTAEAAASAEAASAQAAADQAKAELVAMRLQSTQGATPDSAARWAEQQLRPGNRPAGGPAAGGRQPPTAAVAEYLHNLTRFEFQAAGQTHPTAEAAIAAASAEAARTGQPVGVTVHRGDGLQDAFGEAHPGGYRPAAPIPDWYIPPRANRRRRSDINGPISESGAAPGGPTPQAQAAVERWRQANESKVQAEARAETAFRRGDTRTPKQLMAEGDYAAELGRPAKARARAERIQTFTGRGLMAVLRTSRLRHIPAKRLGRAAAIGAGIGATLGGLLALGKRELSEAEHQQRKDAAAARWAGHIAAGAIAGVGTEAVRQVGGRALVHSYAARAIQAGNDSAAAEKADGARKAGLVARTAASMRGRANAAYPYQAWAQHLGNQVRRRTAEEGRLEAGTADPIRHPVTNGPDLDAYLRDHSGETSEIRELREAVLGAEGPTKQAIGETTRTPEQELVHQGRKDRIDPLDNPTRRADFEARRDRLVAGGMSAEAAEQQLRRKKGFRVRTAKFQIERRQRVGHTSKVSAYTRTLKPKWPTEEVLDRAKAGMTADIGARAGRLTAQVEADAARAARAALRAGQAEAKRRLRLKPRWSGKALALAGLLGGIAGTGYAAMRKSAPEGGEASAISGLLTKVSPAQRLQRIAAAKARWARRGLVGAAASGAASLERQYGDRARHLLGEARERLYGELEAKVEDSGKDELDDRLGKRELSEAEHQQRVDAAVARWAKIRTGKAKPVIVHAYRQRIASNTKTGADEPPIIIRRGRRKAEYAHAVEFFGPTRMVYQPHAPIPGGARLWIEAADAHGTLREPVTPEADPYAWPTKKGSKRSGPNQVQDLAKGATDRTREAIARAAAETDPNPTAEEAKSGSYRKGHANLHGLTVVIETPKGCYRRGKKDGKPWAVRMPGHYGEIAGTEGADGDPVDVTLGPDAANPRLPVWVIDQVRLPAGVFDEHKCFIGWASRKAALAAYDGSFNDGSGPQRRRAVTRLPLADFRTWLQGPTKGALAKADDDGPKAVARRLGETFRVWLADPTKAQDAEGLAAALEPVREIFARAAIATSTEAPTPEDGSRFLAVDLNARNPRVENFARTYALNRIRQISDEARASIRQALVEGTQSGLDIPTQARMIREAIGLSPGQRGWVQRYRAELEMGQFDKAKARVLRDRRHDRVMDSGEPLSDEQVDKMVGSYQRRILAYRATTIARTEGLRATNHGQVAGVRVALEEHPELTVEKTWIATTTDDRTREAHVDLNGQKVLGLDTPFTWTNPATGKTDSILWPHDPQAAADQVVNCRCTCGFRLVRKPEAGRLTAVAV